MDHIQEKCASARDWTLRLAEDGVTSCQEHSLSRLARTRCRPDGPKYYLCCKKCMQKDSDINERKLLDRGT